MTVCPEYLLISFIYWFLLAQTKVFHSVLGILNNFKSLLNSPTHFEGEKQDADSGHYFDQSCESSVAWTIVYICMCIRLESDVIMGWWNKLEKPMQSLKWTVWVSRLKDGVIWRSVSRYKDSSQERNRLYDFTSGFREHELSPQLLERQKCERHSHTQGKAALSIPGITGHWQTILTLSSEPVQLNGCSV